MAYNLPPGTSPSDLPGNSAREVAFETALEEVREMLKTYPDLMDEDEAIDHLLDGSEPHEILDMLTERSFRARVFEYLDALRETGVTNMHGAGPWIMNAFDVDRHEARSLLRAWMDEFEIRVKRGEVSA